MERKPRQDLMTHRDSPGAAFSFTASACHGAVRLKATGQRTLGADLHEHQLFIHLVLDHRGRRVLLGNKSGSAAEFLDMEPDRRAEAVASIVSRARPRLPPECAEAVERMCVLAAAYGRENACDDVTVAVVWRPRAGEVAAVSTEDTAVVADRPSTRAPSSKPFMFWLLGYLGGCDGCRRQLKVPLLVSG